MSAAVQSSQVFVRNAALSSMEMQDLSWFFDGAEGSFGVRSNFGAMEDELVRRSLSDDARIELQTQARRRARARRFKPQPVDLTGGLAALYAAVGMRVPPPLPRPPEEDLIPDWGVQYMHVGADAHGGSPPNIDFDLKLAQRATHTRNRLVQVGTNWTGVLFGAYGPAAARWKQEAHGNPDHPVTKMDNPALGELCIAIIAFERTEGDPSPYELLYTRCATSKGLLELRNKALDLLWQAHANYLATRCPRPPNVHKTRRPGGILWMTNACARCWPM